MKTKLPVKRLLILLIALAGAVFAVATWPGGNGGPQYRTAAVTRGDIGEVVTANGTLNPVLMVNVGTQVSGQISAIYVNVNDEVKKDQLLAEIDPSLLEAQLRESKSRMETAKLAYEQAGRDLERTRMLVGKDYLPKVDLERAQQAHLSAKNSYDGARSQVERDEVNLNYTKIYSPINGVVVSQEVTSGQTVAATYQTPNMFKIAGDLTQMKIDVAFSESDISKIKSGMKVKFTVDAFPGREFEGKVDIVNLNPTNTSGVVTYSVSVLVDNHDRALLPGMTAYVNVTLSEIKDALLIPAAALRFAPPEDVQIGVKQLLQPTARRSPWRRKSSGNENADPDKATIHLLKDGQIVPVEVAVEGSDEMNVAVSGEGVAEGDTVLTGILPPGE